jgi:hypothetical protein
MKTPEMKTSTLPIHGGLVEIAKQMAGQAQRRAVQLAVELAATESELASATAALRRLGTYDPVHDGDAWCPTCHIERNKPSKLVAVKDDDPAESRRYDCDACGQPYRVGV